MADMIFPTDTDEIDALNAADYFLVADSSADPVGTAKDILISALMTYIIANIDADSVGLGNVTNKSESDLDISDITQAEVDTKAEKGYQEGFADVDLTDGVLTVTHDLGNAYPSCVTVWDNLGNIIEPDEVTSTSTNVTTIDLGSYGTLSPTWYVSILGV